MSGEAPDPQSVAQRCAGLTKGTGSNNTYLNMPLERCIVDLDTGDSFVNVVFKNSVINYSGGDAELCNVRFVNCTFNVSLSKTATPGVRSFLWHCWIPSRKHRST